MSDTDVDWADALEATTVLLNEAVPDARTGWSDIVVIAAVVADVSEFGETVASLGVEDAGYIVLEFGIEGDC